MNILNIREARKVSLVKGIHVRLQIQPLTLRFNIDHFGDQSFVQISFHIQNFYIISIKIMVRDYSVIDDHRMCGHISFYVVSMFSNSCL